MSSTHNADYKCSAVTSPHELNYATVLLLTGPPGSGKSTLLAPLCSFIRSQGVLCRGWAVDTAAAAMASSHGVADDAASLWQQARHQTKTAAVSWLASNGTERACAVVEDMCQLPSLRRIWKHAAREGACQQARK